MFLGFKLMLVGTLGLALVHAQNDGRYRPNDDGRYRPSDEGKYRPTNDGKYSGNDGRYNFQNTATAGGGGGGDPNINFVRIGDARSRIPVVNLIPTYTTTTTPAPAPIVPEVKTEPVFIAFTPRTAAAAINTGGANPDAQAQILRQEQETTIDGYRYLYETENGILAEENGRIERLESGDEGIRANGYYQYTGDDGQIYRVDYVADDNGFVPRGDHLPTPPPIPPEIQEVLNILATKPPDTAGIDQRFQKRSNSK